MASVTLNAVWVALVTDLASPIVAGSMGSLGASSMSGGMSSTPRTDARTTAGGVRQYANGNFRAISVVGTAIAYNFTLREVTMADVETLEGWLNQVVLLRDRTGRRWYGAYSAITIIDYPGGSQLHDAAMVFNRVTYSDAV